MKFRQVEARDIEAVYAVSLATGSAGSDASHLYRDGALVGLPGLRRLLNGLGVPVPPVRVGVAAPEKHWSA